MDEERQKKIFLMKIGVISLAVLILILWVLNLKNFFSLQSIGQEQADNTNWSQVKDDFQKMSTEMADRLNKIQTARDTASGSALISDLVIATSKLAPTETGTTTTSSAEIIASSSAPLIATTSLATEKNIQNCPEYIDCMPKTGSVQPCVIPAGCEEITKIAY